MTTSNTQPDVEALIDKLNQIDLNQLDVQQQLIVLRDGKDWNFFIIPITVLLLIAGISIGLNFEKMIWGFVGGALLAMIIGYAYHLWDLQWQKAATEQVVSMINDIEGEDGFLPWFKPILAKSAYRVMFYKLTKRHQIEIEDYIRAIRRLQEKETDMLRQRLFELYPNQDEAETDVTTDTENSDEHQTPT